MKGAEIIITVTIDPTKPDGLCKVNTDYHGFNRGTLEEDFKHKLITLSEALVALLLDFKADFNVTDAIMEENIETFIKGFKNKIKTKRKIRDEKVVFH